MSETSTRWATPDDARPIAAIHVHAWKSAYRGLLPATILDDLNVDDRTESWRLWITRSLAEAPTDGEGGPTHRLIIAEHDDEVVGWATFGGGRDVGAEHRAELAGLYVHPERWQRGIGAVLMQRALQELQLAGLHDPYLWVLAGNVRAISFYERYGWRADGGEKLLRVSDEIAVTELRFSH